MSRPTPARCHPEQHVAQRRAHEGPLAVKSHHLAYSDPALRAGRHRPRHAATQPIGCSWETTHGGIQPGGCPVETVHRAAQPSGCPPAYPGRRDPALGLPGPVPCASGMVGARAWSRARAGSRWLGVVVFGRLRSFVARAASRRAAQDDTRGVGIQARLQRPRVAGPCAERHHPHRQNVTRPAGTSEARDRQPPKGSSLSDVTSAAGSCRNGAPRPRRNRSGR
jgi:hypothetical protein